MPRRLRGVSDLMLLVALVRYRHALKHRLDVLSAIKLNGCDESAGP